MEYHLSTPLKEEDILKIKAGDILNISGTIITARDRAHQRALESPSVPADLNVVYHCGPLVKKTGEDEWQVISAGPTTSARMDGFTKGLLKKFNTKLIIGKGGMDQESRDAMKKHKCIYGVFTGGAGVLAAESIKKVKSVQWLDLGIPEALWVLEVHEFGPLIIAHDTNGNTIF